MLNKEKRNEFTQIRKEIPVNGEKYTNKTFSAQSNESLTSPYFKQTTRE